MAKLHPWLAENLDDLKDMVMNHDFDGVFVIDGMEGSGKSTLAQQCAAYLDPNFSLRKIVFTTEQFIKAVEAAEKGDCILWDETDFHSDAAQRENNKVLKRFLQVVRERNLFLILVAPYFFELDKYVAVARSRFLIHVKTIGSRRGPFEFYGYNTKRVLYFKGKQKYWDYSVVNHDWPNAGKFGPGYVVDAHLYRQKKRNATQEIASGKGATGNERVAQAMFKMSQNGMIQKDIASAFGVTQQRVQQILASVRNKQGNG